MEFAPRFRLAAKLARFAAGHRGRLGTLAIACVLGAAPLANAQDAPPSPVRWTAARETSIRSTVRLPGSVEAHVQALVATEVAGLVVEVPAREGDSLRKGEVLARLRTDELELRLEAARGQRTEAQARLDRAERQLGRARNLLDSEAIAPEQFDDAFSEFSAWQGRLQQLNAEIARIELDIERCVIRSLFAGTVVEERVEVGEWIGEGSPVVDMVSMESLEVRLDAPERWYGELEKGTPVAVEVDALPGLTEDGTVIAVIPRANVQARTFPVRIRLDSPDARIGAGMLARVRLPVGELRSALMVPKDAVASGPQGDVVWMITDDDTVVPISVQVGDAKGAWVAVDGDLPPGAKVVVRGNERMRPGQKVQGEAMEYVLP